MNKRLFCKDFIVKLNTLDLFPEYPLMSDSVKPKKPRQNVWRMWRDVNEHDLDFIHINDLVVSGFDLKTNLFIKSEE